MFVLAGALGTNEIFGRFAKLAQWRFVANVKREEQANAFKRAKLASEMQWRLAHLFKTSHDGNENESAWKTSEKLKQTYSFFWRVQVQVENVHGARFGLVHTVVAI